MSLELRQFRLLLRKHPETIYRVHPVFHSPSSIEMVRQWMKTLRYNWSVSGLYKATIEDDQLYVSKPTDQGSDFVAHIIIVESTPSWGRSLDDVP